VTVRIEPCPTVICEGENFVVTPAGTPDTLKLASWLKPLLLVKVTEYEVLVPCCTLAVDGPAVTENPDDATTLKLSAETVELFAAVTVTGPDVAPVGITKLMLVAVKLATGAPMLPPPCWLRVTVGVPVPPAVKLLPVTVICVPIGPDVGLNVVITGGGAFESVTFSVADEVLPATSVAFAVIVFAPEISVIEQLNDPL